jgi:NADPH2:quinone reductase
MRAIRAEAFEGYAGLKLVDLPRPEAAEGRLLVRLTAAGVTPLDHTILEGGMPRVRAPLVLGCEGAGVVQTQGDPDFPAGSRVMFFGLYGFAENGTYSEWLAVRKSDMVPIPKGLDEISAAGVPIAYLTAQIAMNAAGFAPGKTVLAPAIGGSVGNAATQLARAQGARHAISTTTSPAKAAHAAVLGYTEVIDLSREPLAEGVRRITAGYGADIVIDGIGGAVLSDALKALAIGGSLTTLGYAAGRQSTIDVTDLIWKRASIRSFSLYAHTPETVKAAWQTILPLFESGAVKPVVARTFPLEQAAEALRCLVEERPFGRVLLTI